MNTTYLNTFLTVCECGNFTEAAKQLYIPQPTVSNRIRYLEEELNQNLFIKKHTGKRTVKLTIAGEKFLPHARQIIGTLDKVKEELSSSKQKNEVNIGSTVPLTHPLLYEKVKSNFSSNEEINMHVSCVKQSNVMSYIINNEIDLALVTEPINDSNVKCYPIQSEKYELILSKEHKLSGLKCLTDIQLLKNENILRFDSYALAGKMSNLIKDNCKKQLMTNQLDLVKQLIRDNYGVAILPSVIFKKEIEEGEIINIPISKKIVFDKINYYLVCNQKNIVLKEMFFNGLQKVI
jgi:DNA-binding transcriptional LysR family regulator